MVGQIFVPLGIWKHAMFTRIGGCLAGPVVVLCLNLWTLASPVQAGLIGVPGLDFGAISQSGSDGASSRDAAGSIQPSLELPPLHITSGGLTIESSAVLQGQVQSLSTSIDWAANLALSIGDPAVNGDVALELAGSQGVMVAAPPGGVTEEFFAGVSGGLVSGEVAPGASVTVSSIAFITNLAGDLIFQFVFEQLYEGGTLGLTINDAFGTGGLVPLLGAESGFQMFVVASIEITAAGTGTTSIHLDPTLEVEVVQTGAANVPEPATMSMFACGMLGLLAYARRRSGGH